LDLEEDKLKVNNYEINIQALPQQEKLYLQIKMAIENPEKLKQYEFYFTKPTKIARVYDSLTGNDIEFTFKALEGLAPQYNIGLLEVQLKGKRINLNLEYEYDNQTFSGYALNPSTNDNLHFAQITKDSIYSSHLYYYPYKVGLGENAVIQIEVPKGWIGVTSGSLEEIIDNKAQESRIFKYAIPFNSGRLPYPLAIYQYVKIEVDYKDRLPVEVFFSEEDRNYAEEKIKIITEKILPFLENLMGSFPFPSLRIIEVFPKEGNTGLAAKSVVMLSKKIWFSSAIVEDLTSTPAVVLVDEIAHQWNFYKVMLPNFLAEGVSEYTDNLFMEHISGKKYLSNKIDEYKGHYKRITTLLNTVKELKEQGTEDEKIAENLKMTAEGLKPYLEFSKHGELPITDPKIFPALYFMKGAIAIHALRVKIGDEAFFKGFKKLFEKPTKEELTLEFMKNIFQDVTPVPLDGFFDLWYFQPGLPEF